MKNRRTQRLKKFNGQGVDFEDADASIFVGLQVAPSFFDVVTVRPIVGDLRERALFHSRGRVALQEAAVWQPPHFMYDVFAGLIARAILQSSTPSLAEDAATDYIAMMIIQARWGRDIVSGLTQQWDTKRPVHPFARAGSVSSIVDSQFRQLAGFP